MRLGKIVTLLLAGFLTFSSLNSLAATKNTNTKSMISTKKQVASKTAKKSEKTTAGNTVGKTKKKVDKVASKATKKGVVKSNKKVVKQKSAKQKSIKEQHKHSVRKHYQTGVASYYANKFNGRRTANGETFSNAKMTAAHRTLPFGTMIEVTNLRNGRSVIVRINDRGPYAHARVVDLSAAAAKKIGMHHSGVTKVKIAILNKSASVLNEYYAMN